LTLLGAGVLTGEIGSIVFQNPPQPSQPLRFGSSVKALKASKCFEEGLLDQIRGIDLGLNPGIDERSGKDIEVAATSGEDLFEGLGVAALSLAKQVGYTDGGNTGHYAIPLGKVLYRPPV
jgi:hypothetical protein